MGKNEGHVVLYRKYRSRNFDEVVGQDHIVEPLKQSIAKGKIAHAYLFTGPRGTGKTSVARIFANQINDVPYQEQMPIDIIEIDGASNRRIDEVRELKERIHVAPVQLKYKVYIIDEVHMLTKEAFNALLKTLEEPPEHAVFILATTEAHKLPATIISRTQRYNFKLLSTEVISRHLEFICKQERINYDNEGIATIAEMAQGSLRDAISLLDQASSTGDVTRTNVNASLGVSTASDINELIELTLSSTPKQLVAKLQKILSQGSSVAQVAKQLIREIRKREPIDSHWLDLINNLLDVESSVQPEVLLEVVLLKANLQFNPKATLSASDNKPKETSTKAVKPTEIESKNDSSRSTVGTLDDNSWQSILSEIKKNNNALYSVMRMATPEYNNGVMSLQFKFEFHQKQVESSKKSISDISSRIMGQNVIIETKTRKPISEPVQEAAPAMPAKAKTVLDTFGGGEVVKI